MSVSFSGVLFLSFLLKGKVAVKFPLGCIIFVSIVGLKK